MSAPAATRWYIQSPNGSMAACCSEEHRLRYRAVTVRTNPADRPVDLVGLTISCEVCAWCGIGLPPTGNCCHHFPDPCPDFDWEHSLCGARAVSELSRLAGRRLPDAAFALLGDTARSLHAAGTFPSVELVERAWAGRDAWA